MNALTLKAKLWIAFGSLLVVIAIALGAFFYGTSVGDSSGYLRGYNIQQTRINELVAQVNTVTGERNAKASEITKLADKHSDEIRALKADFNKQSDKIIADYLKANPTKKPTVNDKGELVCGPGWDLPKVEAINQILSIPSSLLINGNLATELP